MTKMRLLKLKLMACDSPSSFSSENFSDSGEELVGSQALPIPVNTRGTDID